mmetsp:Transcript_10286/g.28003  ORF Transcript_10286/g.28003 Transcript_10286/m.28003 type:complete len:226 (+) Transcript_10286:69-746(+)
MGKGKKISTNPKAESARAAKAEKKAATTSAADKAKEDAYWDAHANPVAKRDLKKEAAAAKAAEAAKKKAELAELKRAEEAAMASVGKKKVQAPKLTKREIDSHKEKQRLQYEQMDAEKRASLKKTIGVDTYERMLDERVDNRMESVMDARSLDEAVRQMGGVAVDDMAEVDRHPERRAKALFAAYFERRLPELKEEKPGLKLMAYKARCFDEWQRSPENPRNFTK